MNLKKSRSSIEMLVIAIGLIVSMFLIQSAVNYFDKPPEPKPAMLKKCHDDGLTLETMQYQAYFRKAGAGIHALEVAKAVQCSKRKRLTAAICKIESGGKKTAFNKVSKAKGLFQVREKVWSKVNTSSALAMTAQHDAIMDELLVASNGNLKKALSYYGGDKTHNTYAKTVISELSEVP